MLSGMEYIFISWSQFYSGKFTVHEARNIFFKLQLLLHYWKAEHSQRKVLSPDDRLGFL